MSTKFPEMSACGYLVRSEDVAAVISASVLEQKYTRASSARLDAVSGGKLMVRGTAYNPSTIARPMPFVPPMARQCRSRGAD